MRCLTVRFGGIDKPADMSASEQGLRFSIENTSSGVVLVSIGLYLVHDIVSTLDCEQLFVSTHFLS